MKNQKFILLVIGLLFLNLLLGSCQTVRENIAQDGFDSDNFKPFFFIHAGDPQIGMVTRMGLGSIEEDKGRFIQLAKRANELNCPFVLVAGDLVHFFYGVKPDKKYGSAHENITAFDEALKNFKEAVSINEQLGNLVGKADTLKGIATCYFGKGEYDDSLNIFKEILKIVEKIGDLPRIANSFYNMGCIYDKIGEYNEALDYFRKALNIDEQLKDLSGKALLLWWIGSIHAKKGDLDSSIEYAEQALTIYQQLNLKNMVETVEENLNNWRMSFSCFVKD